MADGVYFLASPIAAERLPLLDARVDALTVFYGARPHALATAGSNTGWWLEPPPERLRSGEAFLRADTDDLKRMSTGLAFAGSHDRCRVVTAPAGPTALYRAEGPHGTVWSTHAVAAGYLANGSVEIDLEKVPVLGALGFIPNETLVRGVSPVAPSTCIDVWDGAVSEDRFWPMRERLELVPEPDAYAFTRAALLTSLAPRLDAHGAPWLGITAGLDSLVVAAAVRLLGKPLPTFTWDFAVADVEGGHSRLHGAASRMQRSLRSRQISRASSAGPKDSVRSRATDFRDGRLGWTRSSLAAAAR